MDQEKIWTFVFRLTVALELLMIFGVLAHHLAHHLAHNSL